MICHDTDTAPIAHKLKDPVSCISNSRREAFGKPSAKGMSFLVEASGLGPQFSIWKQRVIRFPSVRLHKLEQHWFRRGFALWRHRREHRQW